MQTALENLNWLAVIAAAGSSFLIGGLWYGPLFAKVWLKDTGFTEEKYRQQANQLKIFGISFLLALIAAFNLALFIGPEKDFVYGTIAGFLAGIGWVATMLGILYLFELKSLKFYLINAGFCIVSLTLMGLIIGAW